MTISILFLTLASLVLSYMIYQILRSNCALKMINKWTESNSPILLMLSYEELIKPNWKNIFGLQWPSKSPLTLMKKYYVSFGQIHIHQINGKIFNSSTIAEIEANSYESARILAFELFGENFFTVYEPGEFDLMCFPMGIVKVEL